MKNNILRIFGQNLIAVVTIILLGIVSNEFGNFDDSIALPIYLPAAFTFAWLFSKNRWNIIGIFIGLFIEALINLQNVPTSIIGGNMISSFLIAIANSLEPVIIVALLKITQKQAKKYNFLFKINKLIYFFIYSLLGTVCAGTIGGLGLIFGGYIPSVIYGSVLLSWCISDLAGLLIISPVLILIFNYDLKQKIKPNFEKQSLKLQTLKNLEMITFLLVSGLIQYLILVRYGMTISDLNFAYILFLLIILAGFRFDPLFCTVHVFMVAISTIIGIYLHSSPFYTGNIEKGALFTQIFIIVLSLTNLILVALIKERKKFLNVKVLSGFIPICSVCHKIRDKEGNWQELESYMDGNTEAKLSHGYCDECAEKALEEFENM